MLLQTNSYIVPKDKRTEHARLVARFRQVLTRLGCEHFEAYEQVGANWSSESTGRFVQIMRFRDRKHQQAVQAAERSDPAAQTLIREFCELINFPYQQQQGLFAVGFYTSLLPAPAGARIPPAPPVPSAPATADQAGSNGQPFEAPAPRTAPEMASEGDDLLDIDEELQPVDDPDSAPAEPEHSSPKPD
jgi:hypothetical protein